MDRYLKTTEAVNSLVKLIQLRDYYNNGWKPNWNDYTRKYCITIESGEICKSIVNCREQVLTFSTDILRDQFAINFKDLIEKTKPLYE